MRRAVALVLAPHYSPASVGEYVTRAQAAAGDALELLPVESWHDEPAFIDLLAGRVRASLDGMPSGSHALFTAHSLPVRAAGNDAYARQVGETAAAVVVAAGGIANWSTAWQSAGRTPEPWLGMPPQSRTCWRSRLAADRCSW